ncbi:MAG: hypothetical protein V9E81_04515 [Marmoricola sp.]
MTDSPLSSMSLSRPSLLMTYELCVEMTTSPLLALGPDLLDQLVERGE